MSSFLRENYANRNVVNGNYVINVEKNVIEVELKGQDGTVQNFSDKIKTIETNKIVRKNKKVLKVKTFTTNIS